jgi:tRNA pseudouridine32 synthase/23S rRNA pseudouridine746 synthase
LSRSLPDPDDPVAEPEWTYDPPAAPPVLVYADRDIVVIDKPAGLLSTPGRGPHLSDSAETRLQAAYPTATAVHRLDLDTSGLLLFSLRAKATRALMAQFRERQVQKTYLAWVRGELSGDTGVIDLPLRRESGRPRSVVDPAGRPSRTRWRVRERRAAATLLELHPETGRSHQLRVHLCAIGHPIVGDRFYGPEATDSTPLGPTLLPETEPSARLLLHAHALSLLHPWSGLAIHLVSPLPSPSFFPPEGWAP